jgi:hypothetical protein
MPPTYQKEEEKVQKACKAWQTRNFPSIAAAACSVDAKPQRMRDRLAGTNSRSTQPPTNRLLTDEEEGGILEWLEYLDTLGTRPTCKELKRGVNWLLAQRDRAPDQQPIHRGEHFASRFLERHPRFQLRPEKPRDLNREVAEDVDGLTKWFSMWRDV